MHPVAYHATVQRLDVLYCVHGLTMPLFQPCILLHILVTLYFTGKAINHFLFYFKILNIVDVALTLIHSFPFDIDPQQFMVVQELRSRLQI